MDANAFRHFYNYHFSENRSLWKQCVESITFEQLIQEVDYSHGSVCNQLVHIMSVDNTWFNPLFGGEVPDIIDPLQYGKWETIRADWDELEQKMREYLARLQDEMLFSKPYTFEEDKDLILWQVLLHVVNHGTDHRAQILRILHDMGIKTTSQDYIFYVYDHPSFP
jgi:uncharacterized damage-inducible protein DinB